VQLKGDGMTDKPFQRLGSISNAHVGANFESTARTFFQRGGLVLRSNFDVLLGAHDRKKHRRFDLGAEDPAMLIECKSHKWTTGSNIPSAKMTVWNESMYYFHLAPTNYRKILFVLKDQDQRRGTLAEYYVKNHGHLIPKAVEIWEYDPITLDAARIH
jgi:hypothetical protein